MTVPRAGARPADPAGWTIREADPERDAAACAAIYAPSVLGSATSFEEVAPSEAEFAERIRATTRSYPWLVLEDAGRVVAYAYASQHRARAAYRWAADVSVYVAASHHRRGVGRVLYTELFDRLRAQNLQVLCAGITLPNEGSVGLHRAMGFEPVGVYKRIGYKLGAWRDVMWLELELAPATDAPPAEPVSHGNAVPKRRRPVPAFGAQRRARI
jgi:L-amino acid N-acyltransferase YncA